jgi:hypothetical protein
MHPLHREAGPRGSGMVPCKPSMLLVGGIATGSKIAFRRGCRGTIMCGWAANDYSVHPSVVGRRVLVPTRPGPGLV